MLRRRVGSMRAAWRRRSVPLVLQAESNECGIACLAMLARLHGVRTGLRTMRQSFPSSSRGSSVRDLLEAGRALGFRTAAFRIEPEQLGAFASPCIVHMDLSHYMVLKRRDRRGHYHLNDPAEGQIVLDPVDFQRRFTGVVIDCQFIAPSPQAPHEEKSGVLAFLRSGLRLQRGWIAAIIVTALVLEVLLLLSPLAVQAFTDNVVPALDIGLAWQLMAAFAVVALLQFAFSLQRNAMLLLLAERLIVEWNVRISERLMRLPYLFFARRALAEVYARFRSIEVIQRTITHGFMESALDGMGALFALTMILLYSPTLSAISGTCALIYVLARRFSLEQARVAELNEIRTTAAQHGILLEMLHGITTIKASGLENIQLSRYASRTRAAAGASARLQYWTAIAAISARFLMQFHSVVTVGMGTLIFMQGRISFGMVIAYLSYSSQFIDRCTRLSDVYVQWRIVGLHADRLSDIVDEAPASQGQHPLPPTGDLEIAVEHLSFHFGDHRQPLLRDASFRIGAGECVAIIGRSGSGKSTLIKLMMGLLTPTEGGILYNGVPVQQLAPAALHRCVACVLQEGQLFGGSLFENIASFEPGYDRDRAMEAAKRAHIHDEIMQMPMGYETPVVNMGQNLSGGQKQRLLLARALYQQPRILFLDEATSHLDVGNEKAISAAVAALDITRIMVAHRPETIRIADRVLEFDGASIREPRKKTHG
ncbi:peptidase domain-containing ABC transporter [Xanthomonas fragariae]|uniref:peptidase domain-containing ABC transporter n=1 Tax=Xanthomonas fragariae TaxID=48664 RepID=UPI0022AA8896|nr:peptidase domain-containing ABC transporter [Xanthomonas fragariae]WAT14864.1 peptidase domain-containing ABC transporter [Xanthomonas fragariae]